MNSMQGGVITFQNKVTSNTPLLQGRGGSSSLKTKIKGNEMNKLQKISCEKNSKGLFKV